MCLYHLVLVGLRLLHHEENLILGRVVYLFEHLRQHRKCLAEEAGLRPYLIFPDTVLIDLANLRPTTLGEFGNVKGVGEAKLKKYGLSIFTGHCRI